MMNRRYLFKFVASFLASLLFFRRAFGIDTGIDSENANYNKPITIPTKIIQPDIYPPTRSKDFFIFQVQKSSVGFLRYAPTRKFQTQIWSYNGISPSKISGGKRQNFFIDNQLQTPTSIDFSYVSSAVSGVAGFSIPVIQNMQRQSVSITPNRTGTLIYRSNVNALEQNARGLSGVWIVPEEKEVADKDILFAYQDWIIDSENQISTKMMHPGLYLNNITPATHVTVNATYESSVQFSRNERIRARFVNLCVASNIVLSLYDLYGYIVALDAVPLRVPILLGPKLSLAPSQRVDVIFDMYNTKTGQIYVDGYSNQSRISFIHNRQDIRDNPLPINGNVLPVLNISALKPTKAPIKLVISKDSKNAKIVADSYNTLKNIKKEYSEGAENPFPIAVNLTANGFNRNYPPVFTINNTNYLLSKSIFEAVVGESVLLEIVNTTNNTLSINIERHLVQLLAEDGVALKLPYYRDVHSIRENSSIIVGFRPVNKGRYLLRSANQAHLDLGLYGLFLVK